MNRLWQLYPHFGKVPIRTCLVWYHRGFLFITSSFLPFNLLPAPTFQFFSTPAFQLPPASAFQLPPASTFPCILLHAIEEIHKRSCSYPPWVFKKSLSNGMALHQSGRLCPPSGKHDIPRMGLTACVQIEASASADEYGWAVSLQLEAHNRQVIRYSVSNTQRY